MRTVKIMIPVAIVLVMVTLGLINRTGAQDVYDGKMLSSDGVSLTVYNQGTALVQDRRTFDLKSGINRVNFTDVASLIDPTSVGFKSLTDPTGTVVLEQNYVYDLVNSDALLARYVDQKIQLTVSNGKGVETIEGTLLSGQSNEIILRQDDGKVLVISRDSVRDVRFPDLPDGLITRPTLRWLIQSAQTGGQQVELTYLTGGMNWSADYILLLAADNSKLDLNGWITLNNSSGAAFKDAKLKLVAGDVNRLPAATSEVATEATPVAVFANRREDQVQQRNFNEYKLYEVARPVTVGNNETKQVEFVTAADIPANTFFVYDSSPFYGYNYAITDQSYGQTGITDVQHWLEFKTGKENNLDANLPAGRVRVYQKDVDGSALLIGENTIDHTPKGEMVRLFLGNAFDLVGERKQTDFRLLSRTVLQETYEIHLRNHKQDQTVQIRVPEHLFRWSNWQIVTTSDTYTQLDSATIEFRADVKPGEEKVITYTVLYSWPG